MENQNQTAAEPQVEEQQVETNTTTPEVPPTQTEQQIEEPKVEAPNIEEAVKSEEALKTSLTEKGLDFNELAKEYEENGDLSEETMQKLEKAGYPRPMVEMYKAGLEAKAEAFTQAVYNTVGGKNNFDIIANYVKQQGNDTIKAFNDVLMTGNINQINLVLSGVKAQMQSKYGTTNPTIMSGQTNNNTQTGFKTRQEVVEAMKDSRYQKDPTYTQEVYKKIKLATYQK